MKEKSYYGKSYHNQNSPVNCTGDTHNLKQIDYGGIYQNSSPQTTQQGLERIDSVLARVIEISEGLTGQQTDQSDIRLGEVGK